MLKWTPRETQIWTSLGLGQYIEEANWNWECKAKWGRKMTIESLKSTIRWQLCYYVCHVLTPLYKGNVRNVVLEGQWKSRLKLHLPATMGGERKIMRGINRPSKTGFLLFWVWPGYKREWNWGTLSVQAFYVISISFDFWTVLSLGFKFCMPVPTS